MRPALAVALTVTVAGLAGCSSGKVHDAGVYCAALRDDEASIGAPITAEPEIAQRIELFRQLQSKAPLAVEDQWKEVVDLLQAAATVDLTDKAAVAALSDKAFSTTKAAAKIGDHAQKVCGIALPPIGLPVPPSVTIEPPAATDTGAPPAT